MPRHERPVVAGEEDVGGLDVAVAARSAGAVDRRHAARRREGDGQAHLPVRQRPVVAVAVSS